MASVMRVFVSMCRRKHRFRGFSFTKRVYAQRVVSKQHDHHQQQPRCDDRDGSSSRRQHDVMMSPTTSSRAPATDTSTVYIQFNDADDVTLSSLEQPHRSHDGVTRSLAVSADVTAAVAAACLQLSSVSARCSS